MMTRPEDEKILSDNESDGLEYIDSEEDDLENDSLFSDSPQSKDDNERWRASVPPAETFGEGEWAFQIIGEEVDKDGQILYEVRWEDWQREDGTNTTWETAETIDSSLWDRSQRKRRKDLAAQSLEVDVLTTTDIHNTETFLRSQAFAEKLEKARSEPQSDPFAEMAKLMAKHQGGVQPIFPSRRSKVQQAIQGSSSSPLTLRSNQRASTGQQTENSAASTSTLVTSNIKGKGKRSALSTDEEDSISISSVHKISFERPNRTPMSKKRRSRIVESESSEELITFLSPAPTSPLTRIGPPRSQKNTPDVAIAKRVELQREWSHHAKKEGAAPIFFINDVDDEVIPQLDPSFRYLESKYLFTPAVAKPDEGFLTSCSCEYCIEAKNCDCQVISDLRNDQDVPFFAYTHSGLFAFQVPRGVEVIECNKMCSCNEHCDNRVSQRPRDVPIEIFKTQSYGWGVRPSIAVKRGKVLGVYTGIVLPREDADILPFELSGYRFDLDGDEAEGVEVSHPLYTVDSRLHGNWTRFINHSCSPNLGIYLVLHDTPPQCGLPFIAFVAQEDIPAHTEFTLDYDPGVLLKMAAAREKGRGRKKGKQAALMEMVGALEGFKPCYCGSEQCRGYITV